MTKFKAVLFDVDNTLYNHKQYFTQAFRKISEYLSNKYKLDRNKIYYSLYRLWKKKTSMYPHLFNDALRDLNIDENEVENVVKIFNTCNAKLTSYKDIVPTLKILKKENLKLGVITDGDPERQKRKIESLGLKKFFDLLIYTSETKAKPSAKPYEKVIGVLKEKPENVIYVGDNPELDFKGAKNIGMVTVRVRRGEFRSMPKNKYIDFEIHNMKDVLKIIAKQ